MTASRIFLSAACVLAFAAPASAQMYPGQGVAVNPAATQNGRTVVYPGGTYVRLPPLLEPGQPYPGTEGAPIHLHMPTEHQTHHRAARKETPPPRDDIASAPAAAPLAPPPPKPVTRHMTRRAPPPETTADTSTDQSANTNTSTGSASETVPFSFGGPMPQQQQAPARQPHAEAQQPKARVTAVSDQPETTTITRAPVTAVTNPPEHRPVRRASAVAAVSSAPETTTITHAPTVASIQPARTRTALSTSMTPGEEGPDLSKRSEILFPHNGSDPTPQSASELRELASDLNSALDAGARRVQLDAFGGAPGDKSSDARRVSLKRALVIRQLLINDGVPASRIDVRAMGGIDDSGNADRVDVYVRAG